MTFNYKRGAKYSCKKCKLNNRLADKESRATENREPKDKKLEVAIKRIGGSARSIKKYERAIEIVEKNLHRDKWFESTEEIMVALELLKNNVRTKHQVSFGRYRADFVLPDEKIVLEVDGRIYHTKDHINKESIRDNLIVLSLGSDWEVIRVTDDLINQNITRLVPGIRAVRKRRQALRLENEGMLPDWYSDRKI